MFALNLCVLPVLVFTQDIRDRGWLLLGIGACVGLCAFQFFLIQSARSRPWVETIALLLPLGFMALFKSNEILLFSGVSYLCFRLSYLGYEVLKKGVPAPGFVEHMNFSLFVPTLVVGPISPYEYRRDSSGRPMRTWAEIFPPLRRIGWGFVQFLLLGPFLLPYTFGAYLAPGADHSAGHLLLACGCFYLALYFKFSGFCDMMIGLSAVLGFRVKENFDRPFLALNILEFWRRWHITLLDWLRDLMFTPLVTELVRRFGIRFRHMAVLLGMIATFAAIGLWHGVELNFLIFGLYHALGSAAVYVWQQWRLGRPEWTGWPKRLFAGFSWLFTFFFVAFGFIFFANTWVDVERIFALLLG